MELSMKYFLSEFSACQKCSIDGILNSDILADKNCLLMIFCHHLQFKKKKLPLNFSCKLFYFAGHLMRYGNSSALLIQEAFQKPTQKKKRLTFISLQNMIFSDKRNSDRKTLINSFELKSQIKSF